jgi:hypothetical protein
MTIWGSYGGRATFRTLLAALYLFGSALDNYTSLGTLSVEIVQH